MGLRPFEKWCWAMDADGLETAVWYSRSTDGIHVEIERGVLDIRDAVFLRHQLDRAIRDYAKAAGR